VYVFHNARKHGVRLCGLDPFLSASTFGGWKEFAREAIDALAAPLARARTWLLEIGWRKHGRISIRERPAH
jgi:hypothetical protein